MTNSRHSLSVVIASVNGLPMIGECLDCLQKQFRVREIEVIVADRCGNGLAGILRQKYPWVKLIEAPTRTTIPQLRALAFQEASADVVAVLEDHCIVEKDWAQRMIEAQGGEYPVIGGAVENAACERLVDWAAFFCEYGQAIKPVPEGKVDTVPGNNVSYKRWVLEQFRQDLEAGEWDFVLHEHIKNGNIPLYSIPSITVYHKMSASLGWYILQKFHFARSYAGMRFVHSSWSQRILYGGGTILLPFMLTYRTVSCVWKKGRYHRELLLSFPMLMLLILTWGLGEAVGYIFGAGSSSAKVA
jgi:glycosyltransferase involved in cell wall biosynthesis